MKKNILRGILLLGIAVLGFTSCSDNDDIDDNGGGNPNAEYGAYILNQGQFGANNASLTFRDLQTNKNIEAFQSVNGIAMGDVAQDMIVYGSKMYISVYNSGVIYVTDKNAKILKVIKDDTNLLQPRYLDATDGKVYVSLFDGHLARIDTTTLAIDKKIAVGPNPEGVKIVNKKVYVANSGGMNWANGYNNTVSVVDLDLTSKQDIVVAVNPIELEADKYNNLYLLSRGDYDVSIPSSLQRINTSDNSVSILKEGGVASIYMSDDKIYILKKEYDANWMATSTFSYYDIPNTKIVDKSFVSDGTTLGDVSYLAIDPISKNFYVMVSNGVNNGDIHMFSPEGKFLNKFDTGSSFPTKVLFTSK